MSEAPDYPDLTLAPERYADPQASLHEMQGMYDHLTAGMEMRPGEKSYIADSLSYVRTETDPNTGNVTSRIIGDVGSRDSGPYEYHITDSIIAVVSYPNGSRKAPTVLEGGQLSAGDKRLINLEHTLRQASATIEVSKWNLPHVHSLAEKMEYARRNFAPHIGHKVLKMVGVSGPFQKREAAYTQAKEYALRARG